MAWQPLGFQPIAFAEIDPFCSALLAQRFPAVPNLGDITLLQGEEIISGYGRPDILIGGTPCQSFSVAGKRLGVSDPRGSVTLHFLRLAAEIRSRWIIWENVPGVFSIDRGETFRQILQALDDCGYGLAWRVLDAQFFGVPQRRRRVFLVGCLGDWRRAGEILFGAGSGAWDPAPGRKAQKEDPGTGPDGADGNQPEIAATLEANYHRRQSGSDFRNLVASTVSAKWGKGTGGPAGDECQNLVVFSTRIARNGRGKPDCISPPVTAGSTSHGDAALYVSTGWQVRRFTPRECERLQGFPDDWTLVQWRGKPASDTQRYKAVGNSMAVPVIRWLGERIRAGENLA